MRRNMLAMAAAGRDEAGCGRWVTAWEAGRRWRWCWMDDEGWRTDESLGDPCGWGYFAGGVGDHAAGRAAQQQQQQQQQ
jgi:hypothetical protein